MRSRFALFPVAFLALVIAGPAQAVTFQFFEGNRCTQKALGAIDSENLSDADSAELRIGYRTWLHTILGLGSGGWNDEARSVRITSNARHVSEIRRISLVVYDSPMTAKTDDWARITVGDATRIPPEGVCVKSFEKPFERDGVYLERHPNNGLDGKVSVIQLDCDAACRKNRSIPADMMQMKIVRKKR